MTTQELVALAIVGAAGAWLVARFRRRGLDSEESRGCSSCAHAVEPSAEVPTREGTAGDAAAARGDGRTSAAAPRAEPAGSPAARPPIRRPGR